MLGLPIPEIIIFLSVVLVYFAAAIVGILQLLGGGEKYKLFLSPLVSLAVALEAVILIFRAIALKGVPLTGLFESMIVLTIVFAFIYLFFSIAIRQVWFGSVMVWVILAMILMAGAVAKPASEPHKVAATPWAVAHGITMILGGASIVFATASAFLYLLGSHKLKQKKIMQVLGRVPNIEKLERMILFGIRTGFVLITIGLISGFGLVWLLRTGIFKWLTDPKVICIIGAWILLGVIQILNRLLLLKGKARAYMTTVVFVLVLFAILGATILGTTIHDFSRN
ncbi:MAG: cytochrome c biogenesis protein CcsA [Phycisphaerae bacterium]